MESRRTADTDVWSLHTHACITHTRVCVCVGGGALVLWPHASRAKSSALVELFLLSLPVCLYFFASVSAGD